MPEMAAITPPVEFVLRSVEVRPESARLVVVALVLIRLVVNKFVEVALVVVAFVIVTPWNVEEAPFTMRPRVVVGRSAPETMLQSRKDEER